MFSSGFNHYSFAGGAIYTLHVFGNEAATKEAGVYIPKDFSDVKITSTDTVIATNPNTKQVMLIAHVKVGNSMKTLRNNMKTVRENGTVYVGQNGGKGSNAGQVGIHAHLTLFVDEASRLAATRNKHRLQKRNGGAADYTPADAKYLGDFRTLIK